MGEEKFISELKSSRRIENSIIAYLSHLLAGFFSGEIDEEIFKREFLNKTRWTKVCLSLISKDDIKANKII